MTRRLACLSWAICLLATLAVAEEHPSASRQLAAQLLAEPDVLIEASRLRRSLPAGTARASLQPMFSAQGGSWPFEPFVHNGLFRVIAGYQTGHPRAIVLQGGSINLRQLHRSLKDPKILRPHKDGYLLSFPLLIGTDAALLVEGETLYLSTQTGAALINRGVLQLKHAVVRGWQGEAADPDEPFRPFIIAWAGSTTLIEQSQLSRLGFNAHLARGLTLARAAVQRNAPPARLLLRDSLVDTLATGTELHDAEARIENTRFESLQQYGIDLRDSQASLLGNHIDQVRNHSGIRLRGHSEGVLRDNLILRTGKAGIEVLGQQGRLRVHDNRIAQAGSNGIRLTDIAAGASDTLLIAGNLIVNSAYSGVEAHNVGQLWLLNNRIQSAPEYAFSLRNPPASRSHIEMHGNQLATIGKAMIRIEGLDQLRLAANQFHLSPRQSALAGELTPVQSTLMQAIDNRRCLVEVTRSSEYPQVRTLECAPL
jgi:poly(beta-D-mannuronate) C5 epimerase